MKWKSLQMPKAVEVDETTFSDRYGKFIVQPLERGFGATLGNALRRTLLSSIQGAAIKAIKIDGVQHEFTTIPHVVEDVPEIILNLKEVYVKFHADDDITLVVEKSGSCTLTARDLLVDPDVEVMNPGHHIATLGDAATFRAEITIGHGRGYVPAEENKLSDQSIGTIPTDSVFSPIRRVNYLVDTARVGRRIDYDKLVIEVWTNGTIRPDDAVSYAAKILKDHVELFINFEEEIEQIVEEEQPDEDRRRIAKLLKMRVDELELSVRSANCLRAAGIETLRDLVQRSESEMLRYRNFGRKSLNELNNILTELGLSFGMDMNRYRPFMEEVEAQEGVGVEEEEEAEEEE
ncbi:MAG: DNA-directed RNA polymerase subunit alpha [Candidatus Latescibacteria bacterium]|nr:DNA-directed RNA polymerase subunit alpha [Candidatus Latescibacterota bacterium]